MLDKIQIPTQSATKVIQPKKHFIFVCDFSGSMYYDLPNIRDHILQTIEDNNVELGSLVSIVYFSGVGQQGIILKEFAITEAIDKAYLRSKLKEKFSAMGLTNFIGGLSELRRVLSTDEHTNVVQFLTDGYNNCGSTEAILSSLKLIARSINSLTIVEYGNYCNHELLVQMADIASEYCSARAVYSKEFTNFRTEFSEFVLQSVVEDKIKLAAPKGSTYACVGANQYKVVDGEVSVPKIDCVYFIGPELTDTHSFDKQELYYFAYHAAYRMYSSLTADILARIGDIRLWNVYNRAIGKQRLNEAISELWRTATTSTDQGTEGYSTSLVAKDDAFCLLDLLKLLESDSDAAFYPYSNYGFKYKTITQPSVQSSLVASQEEKELIKAAVDRSDWSEVQELTANKYELGFNRTQEPIPFTGLVFNSSRANLSIRAHYKGYVDLAVLKDDSLPARVWSEQFRNYALVADGVVNVDNLPVSVSECTHRVLQTEGLIPSDSKYKHGSFYVLDLSLLPVVNRESVKTASAEAWVADAWALAEFKASLKVVKYLLDKQYPSDKVSTTLDALYGADTAAKLADLGFTQSGFNPKVTKLGDWKDESYPYLEVEFRTGAKGGLFKLPSVESVEKKVADNKTLNTAEKLMDRELSYAKGYFNTEEKLLERCERLKQSKREVEYRVARTQFAVLLSNGWFTDIETDCRVLQVSALATVIATIGYGVQE